jgi:hypothetical protein
MAYKRKKSKTKTIVRRVYARKSTKKAPSGMGSGMKKLVRIGAPILYGALRDPASDLVNKIPFLKEIPITQFTDEAIMLGTLWAVGKTGVGKRGLGASLLRAGKDIELGRIGETMANIWQAKRGNNNNFQM